MFRDPMKWLAAVLLRLTSNRSATQGIEPIDTISPTQTEVAVAANLSTTVLTRLLNELGAMGAVKSDYGKISILSAAVLKDRLVAKAG
ncbi:MAG: helix-turn-helix domain-containing protein [Roseobacter sp.]